MTKDARLDVAQLIGQWTEESDLQADERSIIALTADGDYKYYPEEKQADGSYRAGEIKIQAKYRLEGNALICVGGKLKVETASEDDAQSFTYQSDVLEVTNAFELEFDGEVLVMAMTDRMHTVANEPLVEATEEAIAKCPAEQKPAFEAHLEGIKARVAEEKGLFKMLSPDALSRRMVRIGE